MNIVQHDVSVEKISDTLAQLYRVERSVYRAKRTLTKGDELLARPAA